jgi:hypothetical protein
MIIRGVVGVLARVGVRVASGGDGSAEVASARVVYDGPHPG